MSAQVCPVSLALAIIALLCAGDAFAFEWQAASPESQGMSSERLETMGRGLRERRTEALLVIRNDRIVYEWYAGGAGRDRPHYTASLAKALVGGVCLMVAMDEGYISPDDPACKYVPQWAQDPVKSRITIAQLATHYSGIEDAEQEGLPHEKLPGWKGDFWKQKPNPFATARDHAPVIAEPGTRSFYSNPGIAMVGYCVTAALRGAPQEDLRSLLRERIMGPLGVPEAQWSMGYGKTFELDGLKLHAAWGGGAYSPNAVARVGRLMLREGDWEGRRLVSAETVRRVTADAGMPPDSGDDEPSPRSGLCWWLNSDGRFARAPRDLFAGAGAGNQMLLVIPSLDTIVVRNGSQLSAEGFWEGVEQYLLNPLVDAVMVPPYPPSPVIRSVEFAPVASIRREAIGSDNWPITWGDDDAQYTSYGDGRGFAPGVERKLSLGIARVLGGPKDFVGQNLRSESVERTGDGRAGPKAGGMLMVDGVLYMLVRNVGNSQLVWSEDRGASWRWGFRFEESFGCPTFLNCGRDYTAAEDEYVYVYSCDGPGAYESYDQMALARVPKREVRDRGAYEFLAAVDGAGAATWTRDIAQRGSVFSYPGHCGRADVVYSPALKRYLLALGFDHKGGWGLFDAPRPWGPWTTVFHTEDWGLGQTHSYRLPAKWISSDSTRLAVVFSGRECAGVNYDAFCVREVRLEPSAPVPQPSSRPGHP